MGAASSGSRSSGSRSSGSSSSGSISSVSKNSGSDSSSSSGKSGSSGAKKGEEWTYKLHFDPEAAVKNIGAIYAYEGDVLYTKLKNIAGTNGRIIKVFAYKENLWLWHLTKAGIYHKFIVLQTEHWWWSFEKNSEGITLQRSFCEEAVRDKYRNRDRNTIELMEKGDGKKCIMDLFVWLETELQNKYNLWSSNCKHFASELYFYVTTDISAMFLLGYTDLMKWSPGNI